MIRIALLLLATLLAGNALADEAQIRAAVETQLGVRVEGIRPAPIAGLYEVRFKVREGYHVVYTDADASHIIVGNIYDAKAKKNLTEERMRKLSAIDFGRLPLDSAVKIKRGNGRRVVAMFSDPYCPACRRFEQELKQVDNVTIYVFMYPVIRPENIEQSRAVWCSADRAKAWLDLAAGARPVRPSASPKCENPVDRILALGHSLGINSTPTLFLSTGERLSGGLAADDLAALLDETAGATAKSKARR